MPVARGGDALVATTGGEPGQDPILLVVAAMIDKPHLYDGERPDLT